VIELKTFKNTAKEKVEETNVSSSVKEYISETESMMLILEVALPSLILIVMLTATIKFCCTKYKSKCKKCSNTVVKLMVKIKDKVMFSSVIRFFLVGYLAMCLQGKLYDLFDEKDFTYFESGGKKWKVNLKADRSIQRRINVALAILIPIVCLIFALKVKVTSLIDKDFETRWGSLWAGVNVDQGRGPLIISFVFFIRRALFVCILGE
jgi:hypothetical protein